jgi:hypothetical protein
MISDLLYFISDSMQESEVTFRLKDLGNAIEFLDFNPDTSQTYAVSERLGRSLYSLDSFLENPLIGNGLASGHAFWLDRLALFGLLGFCPWLVIYYKNVEYNLKLFNKEYLNYYIITITFSILFGLLKNMGGPELWLSLFFIAPGVYFLKNLKIKGILIRAHKDT